MKPKIVLQILALLLNEHICQMSGERRLPLIVQGPIIPNEINHDLPFRTNEDGIHVSEPGPIIENIEIKSNLTDHFDRTSIKCFVKNPSIRSAHKMAFSIELPFHTYKVTNMTLQVHGDKSIYKATHIENADILYRKLSDPKQSVVMLKELKKENRPYGEAKTLSMNTTIPAGEKLFITLDYEGPLMTRSIAGNYENNHTWNHIVHINPHQLVQNFSVNVDINETLPIVDVVASEIRNQWPVLNNSRSMVKYGNTSKVLHVSYFPGMNGKENSGYDMSGQFYTSYSRNKTFLLSKVGQDITDMASLVVPINAFNMIFGALDFMFNVLLMIPFIIMTEMIRGMYTVILMFLGADSKWYLDNQMWYERELDHEMEQLEKHIDNTFDVFEDTFDHLDRNAHVPPPSFQSNHSVNSLFLDYSKVLQETSPHGRFNFSVTFKKPLVRKF